MPTAHLVYDDRHATHAIERMQIETADALAELNRQLVTAIVVELAKLAPRERRLLRWELAPVESSVDHDTSANTWTLVVECDPPKFWMVEPGSDDDLALPDEIAVARIKAGAGACRFDTDGDGDCPMALCDHCHPESWL